MWVQLRATFACLGPPRVEADWFKVMELPELLPVGTRLRMRQADELDALGGSLKIEFYEWFEGSALLGAYVGRAGIVDAEFEIATLRACGWTEEPSDDLALAVPTNLTTQPGAAATRRSIQLRNRPNG